MSKSNIPAWVENRVLQFFNQVQTANEISEAPALKDHSGKSNGYVIGHTVAQRIVDRRNELPARRFRELQQLLDTPGFGDDKFEDVAQSLAIPADTFFRERLYGGIILDNWELNPLRFPFETEEEFKAVAENESNFRDFIAEKFTEPLSPWGDADSRYRHLSLRKAHLEVYPESHLAAFQFAFWWYLFDQDNWFSYDTIKGACEEYLGYYSSPVPNLEFRLFKGFRGLPLSEVTRIDMLPVVVNAAEQVITIWQAELND